MQLIPDWYTKLIKRIFLAYGLYVAGTVVVGAARELMKRAKERHP